MPLPPEITDPKPSPAQPPGAATVAEPTDPTHGAGRSAGDPASLAARLAHVSAAITEVARDGSNTHFGYSYATAEAILAAVRGPLATEGVTLTAEIGGPLVEVRELSKSRQLVRLPVRFTFRDGSSDETLTIEWLGEAADAESSGIAKAMTNALRTFLRTQFLIPQAADDDASGQRAARGGQRRDQMARRPAEALTPAMYSQLVEAFQTAGAPGDVFAQWLDEQGIAANEEITARVLTLNVQQGKQALEFLIGLGVPVTDDAKAGA